MAIYVNGVKVSSGIGIPGKTPEKGVDYWTEEDVQELINQIMEKIPTIEPEIEWGNF